MIEEFVFGLVESIRAMPVLHVYLIFLGVSYLENVLPPIPGDILIVFGGYLAADGIIDFSYLLIITAIGSVIGFMNMYYFGYKVGDEIRINRGKFKFLKYFDDKYMDKVEIWMHRWGQGVILANRFLAGTRSIISITAGVTRTKVGSTIIFATISALAWNFVLIIAGWYIGENWQSIQYYLNVYGTSVLVIVIVFFVIRYSLKSYRKAQQKKKKSFRDNN